MSFFSLYQQPVRKKRKGIWLRYQPDFQADIFKAIKKSRNLRRNEQVIAVVIAEVRPDDMVLLEVTAQSLKDMHANKNRSNVFHVLMKENPEWTCSGDFGAGEHMKLIPMREIIGKDQP